MREGDIYIPAPWNEENRIGGTQHGPGRQTEAQTPNFVHYVRTVKPFHF